MKYNTNDKIIRQWLLSKKAILEEYKNQVYLSSANKEDLVFYNHSGDYIIYEGNNLLTHPFLQEDGTLREATDKELIDKGIYSLEDSEVLVGDTAKSIYEFKVPEEYIKPTFDKVMLQWVESASLDEISNYWKDRCKNISSQILVLEKASLEGDLEYITLQEDLNKAKENYITASHELALEMDVII